VQAVQPEPQEILDARGRERLTAHGLAAEGGLRYNQTEKTMRQIVVYPGEDGYWVSECPSLPGCISQGKTREEAVANMKEAIRGYIAALEEDHLAVPPDRFEALLVAV
jgi:predicted RNase H-like HicB family nuclease